MEYVLDSLGRRLRWISSSAKTAGSRRVYRASTAAHRNGRSLGLSRWEAATPQAEFAVGGISLLVQLRQNLEVDSLGREGGVVLGGKEHRRTCGALVL